MASGGHDPYNRQGRRAPSVPSAQQMPKLWGKNGGLGGRPIGHGGSQPMQGPGKYDASARSSYDSVNRMRDLRERHMARIKKVGYGSSPRSNSISGKIGDRGRELASYDGDKDKKDKKPAAKKTPTVKVEKDVTVTKPVVAPPPPAPTVAPNGTPTGILGLMHRIHDQATAPILAQPNADKNRAAYEKATEEPYDGTHSCDADCSHDGEDAKGKAKKHGGSKGKGGKAGAGRHSKPAAAPPTGPPAAPEPPAAPVAPGMGMAGPAPSPAPGLPMMDGEDAGGATWLHQNPFRAPTAGAGRVTAGQPGSTPAPAAPQERPNTTGMGPMPLPPRERPMPPVGGDPGFRHSPGIQPMPPVEAPNSVGAAPRMTPAPPPMPMADGASAYDGDKMEKTMHEFKHGELHSGSKKGPKVTNRKQAIAIGMSQARKAGQADGGD